MAEDDENLDFLGNSSMFDLAMRMNELDKEIEAISAVEEGSHSNDGPTGSARSPKGKTYNFYETPDEISTDQMRVEVEESDRYDDDDDDADSGLEDLKKEIQQVEAQQEHAAPILLQEGEAVTATCVKPTLTSSIGISMKTSKGLTTIVGVAPNGLLAKSDLRPNMQLVQVNGCTIKNAKHAKFLIESHPGCITILARRIP